LLPKLADGYLRLENLGVEYVRFAMENRSYFHVMFGTETHPLGLGRAGKAAANRSFEIFLETIREGAPSGSFSGTDPMLIAKTAWARVHGISLLGLETDPNGEAVFTAASIRFLLQGLNR
jgi:hypothetical protein